MNLNKENKKPSKYCIALKQISVYRHSVLSFTSRSFQQKLTIRENCNLGETFLSNFSLVKLWKFFIGLGYVLPNKKLIYLRGLPFLFLIRS
jgi:hypothetical protein